MAEFLRFLANAYIAISMTITALDLCRRALGRLLTEGLPYIDPIPFNNLP